LHCLTGGPYDGGMRNATPDTIGRRPATVDRLWKEFQAAINAAYATGADSFAPLRDYAEDISHRDAMAALIAAETAEERRHRANRPGRAPSIAHCVKLLLLSNAARGAKQPSMPPSTDWLLYRRSAVEASVIGWLACGFVSDAWIEACSGLDYAAVVAPPE